MLGPLEARAGSGELLEVGGARLRTLLIMLALRPGQLVPASQLIDGLWPDHPPAGAPNAQALVSRLRRALPDAVIESRPAGYQLTLDPADTDIVRFGELAAAGQALLRTDPAAAAATLREALKLWRGPALVDVAGTEFGEAVIARLDEQKLAAIEHRVDADLLTGVTEPLVAELRHTRRRNARTRAGLELVRRPGRDNHPAVDNRDLVGQHVRFLEVLGGE